MHQADAVRSSKSDLLHLLINSLLFKQRMTWCILHGNHLKIRRLCHKEGISQRKIAEKLRLSKKYLNMIEIPNYQR